jgi:hypothetical protein
MTKDLVRSKTERRNILNNRYALEEVERFVGLKGFIFEDQARYTTNQVTEFFGITDKTIRRYLNTYEQELVQNGYEVVTGERLSALKNTFGPDMNVRTKTTKLGIFNFKSFINLAMLLGESQRARELRKATLDIVIDVLNKRLGNNTKYVNFKDEGFIRNLYANEIYHKSFNEALMKNVDMGQFKYATYTNKIYKSVFKEKSQEYRKILNLSQKENVRDTMYSEIVNLISSFEVGIADEINTQAKTKERKLQPNEVDEIIESFSTKPHWKPLLDDARIKMASRDSYFRNKIHPNLKEYIGPIDESDFNKFLAAKSEILTEIAEENREVFKRLKDK